MKGSSSDSNKEEKDRVLVSLSKARTRSWEGEEEEEEEEEDADGWVMRIRVQSIEGVLRGDGSEIDAAWQMEGGATVSAAADSTSSVWMTE